MNGCRASDVARHTYEELSDILNFDKTSLVLMANNEIMLDQLKAGDYERAGCCRGTSTLQDLRRQSGQPGRCRSMEMG